MIGDIALDINQTITFYQLHGFGGSGIYQKWAKEYQTKTNGTLQTVSSIYFYSACGVWVAPPFFLSPLFLLKFKTFTFVEVIYTLFKYQIDGRIFPKNPILLFLSYIVLFPIDLISCMLVIYIFIPLAALQNGLKCAWNGSVDAREKFAFEIESEDLPGWKMFEYCGEAVPQFILTVGFAINNYPFLLRYDTYFDIPIPITMVSIVFSVGSLIIGFITGVPAFKQLV